MGGKISKDQPCVFCQLLQNQTQREFVYEDDRVFAFGDINKKGAKEHLLVCPKEHIPNVNTLTPEHLDLLEHMRKVGHIVLDKIDLDAPRRLGFHVPPFYSVDHLHLHLVVEPITKCWSNNMVFGYRMRSIEKQIQILVQKAVKPKTSV